MENIITNGQSMFAGAAGVGESLDANGWSKDSLRPYINKDGRSVLSFNGIERPSMHMNATLTKDAFLLIDKTVTKVGRENLSFVGDIMSAGLVLPTGGMGVTKIDYQNQSDINDADLSMSPLAKTNEDRPDFDLTSMPLPFAHHQFSFDRREMESSRRSGTPLDLSMVEDATIKVSEAIEKLTLGVLAGTSFSGGNVYGLTNFPDRLTAPTMTAPDGTNGLTTINEILAMKKQSRDALYKGPWKLLVSDSWDQWLETDYSTVKGDGTLRERIEKINKIQSVDVTDFLPDDTMVLVQMQSKVIRMVQGMALTTVQWETNGGLLQHFKVMAILNPNLRSDYNGNTGIVHGIHS